MKCTVYTGYYSRHLPPITIIEIYMCKTCEGDGNPPVHADWIRERQLSLNPTCTIFVINVK